MQLSMIRSTILNCEEESARNLSDNIRDLAQFLYPGEVRG